MNPPLVKTTLAAPASARLGVARLADTRNPSRAMGIIRLRYFFMALPFRVQTRTPAAREEARRSWLPRRQSSSQEALVGCLLVRLYRRTPTRLTPPFRLPPAL